MVIDSRAGKPVAKLPEDRLSPLRESFLTWLGYPASAAQFIPASMLNAMGKAAQDYDMEHILCNWLSPDVGAPLGSDKDIPTCNVFPAVEVDTSAPTDTEAHVSETWGWENAQ